MQRLRSAEHGCQGLQSYARDVVHRLLGGQGYASRLRVKAHQSGTIALRAKAIFHEPIPDLPRGAVLGDLFEKVVVRVEEEAKTRSKIIDVESSTLSPFDIFDSVVNGESQFLQRGRSRLANVIAADGNRIESRSEFR